MSSVKLISSEYVKWRSRFRTNVMTYRSVHSPEKDTLATREDLIPLYTYSFHRIIGALIQSEEENLRLFNKFSEIIERFVTKDDLYHIYAGENSLEEDRDMFYQVISILYHLGVLMPHTELYESKLIVPHANHHPHFQYMKTIEDVEQWLLSLCRYFKSNVNLSTD